MYDEEHRLGRNTRMMVYTSFCTYRTVGTRNDCGSLKGASGSDTERVAEVVWVMGVGSGGNSTGKIHRWDCRS